MCNICDSWYNGDGQGAGPHHPIPVSPGLAGPPLAQSAGPSNPLPNSPPDTTIYGATTNGPHRDSAPADQTTRGMAIDFGNLTNATAFRERSDSVNRTTDSNDYFRFTLTDTRSIFLSIANLSANADLYLEDANGRVLSRSTNGGTNFEALLRTLEAGTYFIRVDANDSGTIDYRLSHVTHTQHNLGNLTELTSARTRTGTLNRNDHEGDVFRFNVTTARTIWFELQNLTAGEDADLRLYNSSGNLIWYSTFDGAVVDQIARRLQPGTYHIRVDADSDAPIRYRLRYGTESGDGRTRTTAFNLRDITNETVFRARGDTVGRANNNEDYFRFTLTRERAVHIVLAGLTGNANLHLEDANGRTLARSTNDGTNLELLLRTLGAGTYYIRVDANDSSTIDYRLSYASHTQHDLGDLTGLTNERTRSGALNWHSHEGDVYRFNVTGARTVRFTLRNLTAGADADLGLYGSSGTRIAYSRFDGAVDDEIIRRLQPGTYYIAVDADSDGSIRYQLRYGTERGNGQTRSTAYDLRDLTNVTAFRRRDGGVADQHYYRFTLSRERAVYIELDNLSANADLYLEAADGRVLSRSTNGGTNFELLLRTLSAGTYYIRVDTDGSSSAIDYRLYHVTHTQHDLGNLTSVTNGRAWAGNLNRSSKEGDVFRFSLTRTQFVGFQLRNLTASGDADLRLINSSGNQIAYSRRDGAAYDEIVHRLDPGTYYIRVDADSNGPIRYQLRYGTVRGDGRTRATAYDQRDVTDLTVDRTLRGTVNRTNNDDDYFRYTLSAKRTIHIELRDLSADANLYLLDSSGTRIASSSLGGTATDSIVRELNAGSYYIQVDANASGTIDYQLRYRTSLEDGTPRGGATRETAFSIGDLTGARSYRTRSGRVNHAEQGTIYRRFTLTRWRTMRFVLRNLTANADLFLEDQFGWVLQSSTRSGRAQETIVRELGPGTWYVRVNAGASGDIGYQLQYRREPDPARGWTHQTAWYIGNLTNVTAYRTKSGSVNQRFDDVDYRRFRLTETRTLRFELRNLTADADLYLEDASGQVLGSSTRSGTAGESVVRELGPGTWYVRVDANASGSIRYRLRYRTDAATTASAQSLWRDDAMAAGPAPRLDESRRLASAGGMLSA